MAEPGVDRVQLEKQESAAGGGDAADADPFLRSPLEPNEDAPEVRGVYFQKATGSDELALIWRDGDNIKAKDAAHGVVNLLDAGSGISEAQHETLDTLAHRLAETRYEEPTRVDGQVAAITTWTTAGKTTKVREVSLSRADGQVSQVIEKQYDGGGAVVTGQTQTGTISRSGGVLGSISWVES